MGQMAELGWTLPGNRGVRFFLLVVIACFSIGFGAALTPVGEPLSTIAVSKLAGEPHYAGFFFLLRLLGTWVIPAVFGLGLLIAGGMLVPGNIPNIICANKLAIKSSEWARIGVPLGRALMIGCFLALLATSRPTS